MGLLDDAIREHLELKRAHGADPTEVERQEREAFGAAQRAAADQQSRAPEAEVPTAGPIAPPPEDQPLWTFDTQVGWPTFGDAYEFRRVSGTAFRELGPASMWTSGRPARGVKMGRCAFYSWAATSTR